MKYVDVLKALADSNRLAIMCYLRNGEKCVCEIEQILDVSQSATSKHLNKLRLVGLIEARKKAQWVHYSIPDKIYEEYPFLRQLLDDVSKKYVFDASKIIKKYSC
jgi:ArsR family transcriptional regulator